MHQLYEGLIFPPGVRPVSDLGTKIMAQGRSARAILSGQDVGTVHSWGDGWVWIVLATENGETRIVPIKLE